MLMNYADIIVEFAGKVAVVDFYGAAPVVVFKDAEWVKPGDVVVRGRVMYSVVRITNKLIVKKMEVEKHE